ncbi:toprim domain-containing protein, partial [Salmonella enterica subsp. enterica serovar Kentucky]|nr:toprim domain-containing protein [Salmonella enterica subsp. enterica serovar Kentucky]
VATMGSALTDKHVKRLKKIAKNYVLIYDGDQAGQNAIYKAIDLIGEEKTQIVRVPEGLDPDDYSKKYSLESLAGLMENSRIQPTEFLIDYLKPENLSNLQNQLDFIEQMAPVIARVSSITAQDAFIRKL